MQNMESDWWIDAGAEDKRKKRLPLHDVFSHMSALFRRSLGDLYCIETDPKVFSIPSIVLTREQKEIEDLYASDYMTMPVLSQHFGCVIPKPTLLENNTAQFIANLYCSAMPAIYRKKVWIPFGKIVAMKCLASASEFFTLHSMEPAIWIAFACRLWDSACTKQGKPESLPQIGWVFAKKLLEAHRKWCMSTGHKYIFTPSLAVPSMCALRERQCRIINEMPYGNDRIKKQFNIEYRPGERVRLAQQAFAEAAVLRAEIANALACGMWIWP